MHVGIPYQKCYYIVYLRLKGDWLRANFLYFLCFDDFDRYILYDTGFAYIDINGSLE